MSTLERAKTVLWLYGFGVGGAERQALAFAKYLRDRHGALSEVWAFEENGPMTTLCDEAGVPWRSLPIWPMPVRSRALAVASVRAAAALRKAKTEIVLPYMTPANILCCSAWRFARARTCVWNQRNGGIEEIHRGAERFAARRAPALVANSDQGARFLVDTIGAARDRVHVIRNAVLLDAPRLDRAAWRAQLGANDTSFVVAMLANLHRWKDHETLLRAWAIARAELPGEPRLALAGRLGDSAEQLQALAEQLGIARQVAFLGLVDDVSGLLAASDAAVLLNRFEDYEGCPNAIIESMAAGLPVIASDTGGPREVLGGELREWLIAPGDAAQVAQKLLLLARDRELRLALGERARVIAMREFSVDATFGRYAALLERLVRS